MQVNRSASVPRNVVAAYDNPILQGYDYTKDSQPKMMHRRESSLNNLDPRNISMNAGREVMRSSVQLDSQQDRGVSASMVLPTDVTRREVESRSRRQGSWGEFLVRQGEVARRVEHNEKVEDKVRTLKYKEVLDNMVQQEKQKKMAMVKEAREEMVDPQQLQTFSKLERNRAQEEKRQYYSDLQRLINQKETMKQKEHQKKAEELQEFRQIMNHMQAYETRVNEQERMNKKQIFNDYQNAVNQKNQSYAEQKRREEEEAMREREGHFFYRQDQERTQLYNKIKNQVNRDVGTQLADIAYEKRRQVDSFVNRAVQQKEERDAMEMMRRQELLKKRQMDAFENNKIIAAEKMMKNRKDREYREEEGAFISGHAKLTDEIERIKKEQESSQKREYLEYLKGQANARQEAKYRDDMMNAVENRVNRVSPDSPTSAYPFNGRSHERSLQLRYIDKWLTSGSHVKK